MNARLLISFFVMLGCGGAGDSPHVATTPATSASASASLGRAPSEALIAAWPVEQAKWIAYTDASAILESKSLTTLIPTVASLATYVPCFRTWLESAREIAVADAANDFIVVARFDTPPHLAGCVTGAVTSSIDGAQEALAMGDRTLAVSANGIFVVAPTEIAARAFHPHANANSPLRTFRLKDTEVMQFRQSGATSTTLGSLFISNEHLALDADMDFHASTDADAFEKVARLSPSQIKKFVSDLTTGDDATRIIRMADLFSVVRHDRHVALSLDLREPSSAQAQDIGAVANVTTLSVKKYLNAVKQAEAYSNLNAIARAVVADFEAEKLPPIPFAKKKLKSFPAVPTIVPAGTKYTSTPDEWKPWASLHFSIETPQYFQYEIRATKDGESAEVIAHGDLNGDGKTSTFSLTISIDRGAKILRIASAPVVSGPDE